MILMVMIVCPPIDIVNTGSYCIVNMIHATYIWMFMFLIVGFFIECGNKLHIKMDASTLPHSMQGMKFRWLPPLPYI
jgi:hypothetical protein